jgi:acyl transferase domain-containing protein
MAPNGSQDIAIIGLAGLFPKAPDIGTFWSNILGKVDGIDEAPAGWMGDELFLDPDSSDITRTYTNKGGFLGDVARFDPRPFGIMPVSINAGEPDQFLALRCAKEALVDAGYDGGGFEPSRTGVILGHGTHPNRANVNGIQQTQVIDQTLGLLRSIFPEIAGDRLKAFGRLLGAKLPKIDADAVPGLVPNMMTGRIANRLDLMGPNYILDAACASSLMAVDAAMSELRTGRADLMLAGGVNTSTSILVYMVFCQLGALSRTSRIRPFDHGADGTLLGEGQGIVVLKRFDDAVRDGDRIYAVVKGCGLSSDGRATGLMAPRMEGQVLAMRRAYEATGIDPETVSLIEAHGTGIPLGDETEIRSLTAVLGERRRPYPHVALGSVKSMIGHCIPAAGMASLIKCALALHHKVLPPSLCDDVNPTFELERTPLFVVSEAMPWSHNRAAPRRAGINAFGFGGVNSHMILEEAPESADSREPGAAFGLRLPHAPELVIFSEASRAALLTSVGSVLEQLRKSPAISLNSIAARSAETAADGEYRLAIVAADLAELAAKLEHAQKKLIETAVETFKSRKGVYLASRPVAGKLAFLFPGENSQYPGMLKDLAMSAPLVRDWFDCLEGLFADERDIPHGPIVFPPPNSLTEAERSRLSQRLMDVDAGSEAVFFADQAMFGLLTALGVRADAFVGHSTGENAALVASGAFDLSRDETCGYIREMNRIYCRLDQSGAIPKGTLLAVGALPRQDVLDVIADFDGVHFTMDNCPNQAILFGPDLVMAEIGSRLTEGGGIISRLPLAWAYHTPLIRPMADAFDELFVDIRLSRPTAPLYSCTSASVFPDRDEAFRELALDQYVSRVRFTETILRLYEDGVRIFVEVGPSSILTGFVGDILASKPHLAIASNRGKRSAVAEVLQMLAQLFVHGVPMDLSRLYPTVKTAALVPPANEGTILESGLPYLKLTPDEVEEARKLLADAPAPAPAPAPATAVSVPAEKAIAGSLGASRKANALAQHLAMMNTFLEQQAAVTTAAMRQMSKGYSSPKIRDLGASFALFNSASVQMATWPQVQDRVLPEAVFEAIVDRLLSSRERQFWVEKAAARNSHRREWLLGRLAAKSAIQNWLGRRGRAPGLQDIEIVNEDDGHPTVRLRNGSGELQAVAVSLSHTDGTAVAVATQEVHPIGIDLEPIGRIRDAEAFARVAFLEEEWLRLQEQFPGRSTECSVLLWTMKEAAAKALGCGLLGREQAFRLVDISPDGQFGQLVYNGRSIALQARRFQDFVCTLAQAD